MNGEETLIFKETVFPKKPKPGQIIVGDPEDLVLREEGFSHLVDRPL